MKRRLFAMFCGVFGCCVLGRAHVSAGWKTHYLYASNFEDGTYRITEPGKYLLYQDVVFEPSGREVEAESLFPKLDSTKYPQLDGYFLGFFAAIAVEATDVEIDCKGHEIKMSERFHKHQRFFSIIELGSKPFISGQGPPQFSSSSASLGQVRSARNVVIRNCTLGYSSHHGIHGNNNEGVTLQNLRVRDFEVGGISLNGASGVVVEGVEIGPSLTRTFKAGLSQAIFLDHLANTILSSNPQLSTHAARTSVTLRGQAMSAREVFQKLRSELREFLSTGSGALREIAGDGEMLPDGSALYGLLLHRTGVAVADFGACPGFETPEEKMVKGVKLKDIKVHDLRLDAEQVISTFLDGNLVVGPAGDVFRITRVWDAARGNEYVGNPLSDAQIAIGVLRDAVGEWALFHPFTWTDAEYYFGGVNIPSEVQEWAAGKMTPSALRVWASSLGEKSFQCNTDAMAHFNKGVAGLRLGFQEDIDIEDVTISSLSNIGHKDAEPHCDPKQPYKGADVRAVALSHIKNMRKSGLTVMENTLTAPNGRIFAIDTVGQVSLWEDRKRFGFLRAHRPAPAMRADDLSLT